MSGGLTLRAIACLAGLLAASAGFVGSGERVWFVDASAPPSGDGTSWSRAFSNLQSALAASRGGDGIWVVQGIYTPGPSAGPVGVGREATFALRDGVRLYGGFAGDETALDERDPSAHETILSGDLKGDDGPDFAGTAENAFQVVTALHVGTSTVLDGFTIRGGHADGPGFGAVPESREQGAGLNVYFSSPHVENCVFEGNWNLNHGALNDHGEETSVVACTFRGNRSLALGAGLYVHHESRTRAVACTFTDNETVGDGGGAYSRSMEGAIFSGCLFRDNHANLGAGLYVAMEGTTRVEDCEFDGNVADLGGGGVYCDESFPEVSGCSFTRNQAGLGVTGGRGGGGGSGGGGVWANGGSPLVSDCAFRENEASFGGGVYFIFGSKATVRGCAFDRNAANEAGGLYTLTSDVRVEDCTFTRNSASDGSFSVGGGISNYYSNSSISGCTFAGNRADLGGGGIYNEGESPRVYSSIFCGNSALSAPQGWGGGIMNGYFTTPTIAGCAFSGNAANLGGGVFNMIFSGAYVVNCTFAQDVAAIGPEVHTHVQANATLANCILDGVDLPPISGVPIEQRRCLIRGGYAGGGRLDPDPHFVRLPSPGLDRLWGTDDDDYGDLSLSRGSPAVDAGENDAVPADLQQDLAGHPRFSDDPAAPDTGIGDPPLVDIGAYER